MTYSCEEMTSGRTTTTPLPLPGSVSARYLDGIIVFAEQCGADRTTLLDHAGLSGDLLADPDHRLPLHLLPALFASCAYVLGDPAFALSFGIGVPCAQLTLASALAAAQPEREAAHAAMAADHGPRTLRDALTGLNRYAALGVDFGSALPSERYRFVDDGHGVWLEDCRPSSGHYAWSMLTESTFARFATGIRRRGGESIVRVLEVTHRAPASADHRAAYDNAFRVPVHFEATRNALCLDPAFLERPLEPLPTPVEQVLTRHAHEQLQRLPRVGTWRERVDTLLQARFSSDESIATNVSDLEWLCRVLAVSRHTLHRRLQGEGTTFAALYDDVRRRAADDLLRLPAHTIGAVALRLGFSEAAAFSRAYKRWTGRRPGDVRRAG